MPAKRVNSSARDELLDQAARALPLLLRVIDEGVLARIPPSPIPSAASPATASSPEPRTPHSFGHTGLHTVP
jgi:hypothetical protein